jgi:aconitate hydratase
MYSNTDGPFTPDRAFPISQFAAAVKENQWPVKLSAALIGSCTNSSYEDMYAPLSARDHAQCIYLACCMVTV